MRSLIGSWRGFTNKILHDVKIKTEWIEMRDIDNQQRRLRYFDSHLAFPSSSSSSSSSIPLVLLCGTAQTITTWAPHLRSLSQSNRLIIPEMRGQGQTELLSTHSTLSQHIEDLYSFLIQNNLTKINLCGFSLGGRICVAFASKYPQYINKLSITGVPLNRPGLGQLILQSWKEGLEHNEYQSIAWSFILNGFSNQFLYKNYKTIPKLINNLMEENNLNKLKDLLQHSNASLSSFINKESFTFPIQIIYSDEDRLAGNNSERELGNYLSNQSEFLFIEHCGHLIPFEKPTQWRTNLIAFLNK